MLNQETKRKIDSARDILVGKLPDPKSQIDQITTAMIYKFMDDMDKQSEEMGGKSRFFANGYEKYAWPKIMDPKLGGQDRLNLYSEAITDMYHNPHIPQLFRNIFKDAFLPYRNPETLTLFLKQINEFKYEHSEDLGDAFEYLLSIMGSQGDAGQFRTPRHIIDFIVDIVNPQKKDTILDPACGTSGFLISAYKHILRENKDKLTPDERKKLMEHFVGYDISPDMTKLSRVNLYLHDFPNPDIYEYDTLADEEKWDDSYDVIITNPPFMTPKGGIKPHKKFSIKSKRSEALFVDYLIEHLSINGKAGIIVPDGIINNKNFALLRKIIIENGLYAVVSLHPYVFKPYAGAKTCILFFDKTLKENTGNILFAEIEDDGYQKGANRTKITEDNLPELIRLIKEFKKSGKSKEIDIKNYKVNAKIVNINQLDRNIYFHYVDQLTLFPNTYIYSNSVAIKPQKAVRISDVFKIKKGTLQSTKAEPGPYRFVTASDEYLTNENYTEDTEALVIAVAAGGSLGKAQYVKDKFVASDLCFILTPKKKEKTDLLFYLYYFKDIRLLLVKSLAKGVSKHSINKTDFANFLIDDFDTRQQKTLGEIIKKTTSIITKYENKIEGLEKQLIKTIDQTRK